mmetsp:Transcript_19240/g.41892  ORF Transcript_19240/g.41892 Transcript_19240/m.41892 type:complete len:433 (-) Transcript_19240:86-1384(-)
MTFALSFRNVLPVLLWQAAAAVTSTSPPAPLLLAGRTRSRSSRSSASAATSNTLCTHGVNTRLAFAAGGFGASSSKKTKGKSKKKRKIKKGILTDLDIVTPSSSPERAVGATGPGADQATSTGPELDRFGLPINPTLEDIFPPLGDDVEVVPVESTDYQTKLEDVRSIMKDHIPLNYDIFDENGVENIAVDGGMTGGSPMKLRILHNSPPVLAIDNFFTDEECEEYIRISSQPCDEDVDDADSSAALMVDSKTFALSTATRTSTTWFCHYRQVPTLLAKASRLLDNLPLERMEEPQLVRYRTGEQFSYHCDEVPAPQLGNGGQRVATLLVYLKTLEGDRGGATIFRDLKDAGGKRLGMRPVKGSALLFFPAFANGTPDDRTLHKGEIAIDEKMIGQIWVHERRYKPAVPPGNSHEAAVDSVKAKEIELGYRR